MLERAIQHSASVVADARLLELMSELRGVWATIEITGAQPTVAVDLELLWQIEPAGLDPIRSELLIQNDTFLDKLTSSLEPQFANAESAIGPVRLVTRELNEMVPAPPGSMAREFREVTYWAAMTEERRALLITATAKPLQEAGRLVIGGFVLLLAMAIATITVVLRRPLNRLRNEAEAFAKGDVQRLSEDYPSELQLVTTHLNRAAARQDYSSQETKRYINKIVHDLKTPIAVVENAIDDPAQHALAHKRLGVMRESLERYSALASAIGPMAPQPIRAIQPLLRDAIDAMSLLYRPTPLTIELDADPSLNARIAAQDVDTIISNLLSNAHKHAHSHVRLGAQMKGQFLSLSCEDDGPGLDGKAFEQALGWGVRLDERPAGSGFGLAILRDFAELYHGEVHQFASCLGGLGIAIDLEVPQA